MAVVTTLVASSCGSQRVGLSPFRGSPPTRGKKLPPAWRLRKSNLPCLLRDCLNSWIDMIVQPARP